MKKLASIFLLAAIFMVGCQDDSSILEPNSDLTFEQLPKGRPILPPVDDYKLDYGKDSLSTIKYDDLEDIELTY